MDDLIGKFAIFNYGQYGADHDGAVSIEYSKYRGQRVKILNQLSPEDADPEVGPMFKIEAEDGWKGDALLEELEIC